MLPTGSGDRPEARWVRFWLSVCSLAAIAAGAFAWAATDDLSAFWWGIRAGGALVVASGVATAWLEEPDDPAVSSLWMVPDWYVVGSVRVLFGVLLVVATL